MGKNNRIFKRLYKKANGGFQVEDWEMYNNRNHKIVKLNVKVDSEIYDKLDSLYEKEGKNKDFIDEVNHIMKPMEDKLKETYINHYTDLFFTDKDICIEALDGLVWGLDAISVSDDNWLEDDYNFVRYEAESDEEIFNLMSKRRIAYEVPLRDGFFTHLWENCKENGDLYWFKGEQLRRTGLIDIVGKF